MKAPIGGAVCLKFQEFTMSPVIVRLFFIVLHCFSLFPIVLQYQVSYVCMGIFLAYWRIRFNNHLAAFRNWKVIYSSCKGSWPRLSMGFLHFQMCVRTCKRGKI